MMTLSAERELVNFFFPHRTCFFLMVQSTFCCAAGKNTSKSPAFTHGRELASASLQELKKGVSNTINTFIEWACSLLPWTFSATAALARDPGEAMGTCIRVPAGFSWRDRRCRGPSVGLPATALLCCGEVGAHGGHGDSPSRWRQIKPQPGTAACDKLCRCFKVSWAWRKRVVFLHPFGKGERCPLCIY